MERIERIKEFLSANPGDSFLQHALALEYIKVHDDIMGRSLFEEILTRDPGYTGSYYHLAKLLERLNLPDLAMEWYQKGMQRAKDAGDNHTYNELRAAYEEIADD
ncbi:MAG: hypothetical protein ABI687_03620 [Flavitalea sp.]